MFCRKILFMLDVKLATMLYKVLRGITTQNTPTLQNMKWVETKRQIPESSINFLQGEQSELLILKTL